MKRDVLFLDLCGVIHDCGEPLAAQWRSLVGAFLASELGGEPEAWGAANAVALERATVRWRQPAALRGSVSAYWRREDLLWVRDMCEQVGVPMPEPSRADALAIAVARYVTTRTRPTFPEVPDALHRLRAHGYTLHTAAGPRSIEVEGYLRALGVRELFGNLYGPDLVDAWKDGADFYRAILGHSGTKPERAIVIDDQARHLDAAREAGCETILVSTRDRAVTGHHVARSLADAADLLC